MQRKLFAFLLLIPLTFSSFAFTGSDYSEAMSMAVKFFGAQRCGNTYNWMLHENKSNNGDKCHTKDAYNGTDVSGGWHDCGDHIKVATTMGYAAICLLSAYAIWPAAFDDKYDSIYGSPNKIPDVLDEAKTATDFFMKSLVNGNFVYYVGGSGDHNKWVTSEFQSTLGSGDGGDPRSVTASNSAGGAQAADYSSALTLMAIHYPNSAYASKCKEYSLKLYEFAKAHPTNISIPEFYTSPNAETCDELGLAAILLYNLTGTETYLTEAIGYFKEKWESNAPLAWDTKGDIAYYYITKAKYNASNGDGGPIRSFLYKNVKSGVYAANSYGIPWKWFKSNWGTNKLASGSAFAAALYSKLVEDGVYKIVYDSLSMEQSDSYNRKIVDYMLGSNEIKHPFIHGYKGDMYCKVHHRNAMGRDDNPDAGGKNSATFMFKSGALIGGPAKEGSFSNIVEGGDAFKETESGCDYNGPFIGALANLVSKLDPKENTSIRNNISKRQALTDIMSSNKPVSIVDIRGRIVSNVNNRNLSTMAKGLYFVPTAGAHYSLTKFVNVK